MLTTPQDLPKDLGLLLYSWRVTNRYTQAELAPLLNITQPRLSQLENAKETNITTNTIKRISQITNTPITLVFS